MKEKGCTFSCSFALIKILQFPFGAKCPINFKKGAKVITFTEKLVYLSFFFSFLSSLACHGTVLIGHIAFKSTFIFSALEGSVFSSPKVGNKSTIYTLCLHFIYFLSFQLFLGCST